METSNLHIFAGFLSSVVEMEGSESFLRSPMYVGKQ